MTLAIPLGSGRDSLGKERRVDVCLGFESSRFVVEIVLGYFNRKLAGGRVQARSKQLGSNCEYCIQEFDA